MSLKSIQSLFFILVLTLISSCGKKVDEEVHDAVLSANILLSTSQCQAAIDLLEAIGNQPRDSAYLKTYATAYACRAGYSTTVFFGSDIAKTAAPAPLGGMTTYSTSLASVTSPLVSDSKYKDLQRAIDILLYAGGIDTTTEPSSVERAKYFNVNQAGEINTQLAFMMLVQLGKFMKVYGNASIAGVKGGGGAGNSCFTDYSTTPALVQTYVTTILSGACTSIASSHAQLATAIPTRRSRLCQGVVLMNGILDLLPSILTSAAGGSLSDIATVTDSINTQKALLVAKDPAIATTLTVLSQANCESDTTNITIHTLASYYAVIFEGLIQ